MNDKGGMNEVEFEKYIWTEILRLYPDIVDVERKQVVLKFDSGPSQMNLSMLTRLHFFDLYLMPCAINTTQVTHETYQKYSYLACK